MKYYIIAGEQSGDLYGSMLIHALKLIDEQAQFRYVGGDKMSAAAAGLFRHMNEISVMGYLEVIKNLGSLNKFLNKTKYDIENFDPDHIIYIDYPGFNLRIARWAKLKNYNNSYFICPKIWAWKKYRYKDIKRDIDSLYSILPFEEKFLLNLGINSHYFGHPLLEKTTDFKYNENRTFTGQIALLPGSRKQEIANHLKLLQTIASKRPELRFIISKIKHVSKSFYEKHIDLQQSNIVLEEGNTYALLEASDAAIVASGTATLEAAIIGIPQLVIYKTDWLSYSIAKTFVKLDYISLPNLIMDQQIVVELIQHKCTTKSVLDELKNLLDATNRTLIFQAYKSMNSRLYGENTIAKIAEHIFSKDISKATIS